MVSAGREEPLSLRAFLSTMGDNLMKVLGWFGIVAIGLSMGLIFMAIGVIRLIDLVLKRRKR